MYKNSLTLITSDPVYKALLISALVAFSFGSCKEVKKAEVDLDLFAVEDFAASIQNSFNTYEPYSIKNIFSPVLFSWRLGSDFKQNYTAQERQGYYSAFNMLYKQSIDSYVDAAELLNLKVYLFDVHQKDNVYRLNYYVTDVNDNVLNYLVFYVDKDRNREFKIVNFYNVISGFTYSDIVAEYMDGGTFGSDRSARRGMEIAANKRDVALYDSSLGDHQKAYSKMKEIDYKYLNSSGFAQYKMIFASQISVRLYKEELKWMAAISKNGVSKKYYECISLNLEIEDNTDAKKCIAEFEELLKAS